MVEIIDYGNRLFEQRVAMQKILERADFANYKLLYKFARISSWSLIIRYVIC